MKYKIFFALAMGFPSIQPLPLPAGPEVTIPKAPNERVQNSIPQAYQDFTVRSQPLDIFIHGVQTTTRSRVSRFIDSFEHPQRNLEGGPHEKEIADEPKKPPGWESITVLRSAIFGLNPVFSFSAYPKCDHKKQDDSLSHPAALVYVAHGVNDKNAITDADRPHAYQQDISQQETTKGEEKWQGQLKGKLNRREIEMEKREVEVKEVARSNITVTVVCPTCPGKPAKLGGEFSPTSTVACIRERLKSVLDGIAFKFMLQDQILTNETKTLEEVGIVEGSVLTLMITSEKQGPIGVPSNTTATSVPIRKSPPTPVSSLVSSTSQLPSPADTNIATPVPQLPAKIGLTITSDASGRVYEGAFFPNDTIPFVRHHFGIGSAAEGVKLFYKSYAISDGHTIWQAGIRDGDGLVLVGEHEPEGLGSSTLTLISTSTVFTAAATTNPITVAESSSTAKITSIVTTTTTTTNLTTVPETSSTIMVTFTVSTPTTMTNSGTPRESLSNTTITSTVITVLKSSSMVMVTFTATATATATITATAAATSSVAPSTICTTADPSTAPETTTSTIIATSETPVAPEPTTTEAPSRNKITITFTSVYFVWTEVFSPDSTVRSLKQALGVGTGVNWEHLMLVFMNQPLLDDEKTLQIFGVGSGDVVDMNVIYATSTVYATVLTTATVQSDGGVAPTTIGSSTSSSTTKSALTQTSVTSTNPPLPSSIVSALPVTPIQPPAETIDLKSSIRLAITLAG